ncbi:MAG: hypothetical protein RJQ14_03425, partial [Marinoscillum sp.]
QAITIDVEVAGANNIYQWMLDGQPIAFQDLQDIELTSFMASDTGTYQLQITNSLIDDLELNSAKYRLKLNDFEEDSLALVSLYMATNGDAWLNNTGWLTDVLANWNGVSISNNRVVDLVLSENNLDGSIPGDLFYSDSLISIDLSGNTILDTLPATLATKWKYIETIDVSNNELTSIPVFNTAATLESLDVASNRLQFGDIESNLGIPTFSYAPQDSISTFKDTLLELGTNLSVEHSVSGANNVYQWFKDDAELGSAMSNPLELSNLQFSDEGVYRLEITNTLATNLTLSSGELELRISSLLRDSIALRTIYNNMGGANWTADLNWTTDPITAWDSITITADRVVEVSLRESNMTGTLPRIVRDITSLESLNLSGNEITSIPNMSQMPNLGLFDVSLNRLGFAEIIPNLTIDNFNYDPQQALGAPSFDIIPVGTSHGFGVKVSGNGNAYQWSLNNATIPGAEHDTFSIESIEYDSMG